MKQSCTTCGQPHSRCNGHRAGKPCGRWPTRGADVCRSHGAGTPRIAAKAAVRAEVLAWGLGDTLTDPGETLLRLVSQSAARAQRYAAELVQYVGESDSLRAALIAQVYGEFGPVGEYVRGLAQLEATERDRCATFATKAIAAGLAERQVRLAERQGDLIAEVLRAVLADDTLGLTPEQRAAAPAAIRRHLAAVA